jgi:hypothetical protein
MSFHHYPKPRNCGGVTILFHPPPRPPQHNILMVVQMEVLLLAVVGPQITASLART